MQGHRPPDDERLVDLARRMLDGEPIDWEQEEIAESEVVAGMKRIQHLLSRSERTATATAASRTGEHRKLGEGGTPPLQLGEERRIGRYLLIRRLGEGGMGVVWEAEHDRPRRRVALKVIRGGVHVDDAALKLFQREVQTLALLQHPGIAALYESGATEDGLHWFAMELVRGVTLRTWLHGRPGGPVTPAELKLRLQVFRKVSEAVAYAHQRGVIHRDLKPANVLVPTDEGSALNAVPDIKILDFGLARITESDTGMTSYHTEIGQVRGTLPYMSPEQVRGNPADIDLRTDVYALGVMLYEMVTGKLPLDVTRGSLVDAMRVICEEPPRSISATYSGTRRLDADVITIAMKALEKDPARRYQSAAALGDDVQHWLNDEPILARRPSATYQFRKLVMRHKLPFAFAGAVFVLLAVLAGAMTVQATRIARERDRANQAAKRAEEEAKRATEEAATAKSVSDFLEGMFKFADPAEARGATITAKEILDRGAAKIQKDLADQPIVQMRIVSTIAGVYGSLGIGGEASPLLSAMRPLIDRYPDRLESVALLSALTADRYGTVAAVESATRALDILKRALPASDPRIAGGYYTLGIAHNGLWRLDETETAFKTALARLDAADRDDSFLRICLLNDLGLNRFHAGDVAAARDYMKQALELRERTLAPDHPDRLMGTSSVAYLDVLLGDTTAARPILTRVAREAERVWSHAPAKLADVYENQAELERRDGHLELAKSLAQRALQLSPLLAEAVITLALTEESLHRPERAVQLLESRLAKQQSQLAGESPSLLPLLETLRNVHIRAGRPKEAAAMAARADRIRAAYNLPATAGTLF